jgi:hypothetical protein
MSAPKLLDCPFCGEPPEVDTQRGFIGYNHEPGIAVAIYCVKCNGEMSFCKDDAPDQSTEDILAMLVENWNKRTPTKS